jgi:transposase
MDRSAAAIWPRCRAPEGWRALASNRCHSVEPTCRLTQECFGGETLHGHAKRHGVSRNLIRVRVEDHETGASDEDATAADLIQAHEACLAALERLIGG